MSLVATRSRRPNAGNRMKELLERELEIEEMFVEVANDEDFMAIQGFILFKNSFSKIVRQSITTIFSKNF
ncbi:hypothetical protein RhiirA1_418155 [Rhizophagus irregularis]|uniref:Vps72/YL1 N-terminal domain-containing protein n=1 Tax=Rhizophagus irregularis TaxID=588596 RepID=A0A2I1GJA2_9GLOM|nr:hypothetical protein RhiirA1_418155 [Rhizophagus irregularis]PKK74710.1 hypothetical protein RhiirC2_738266 [Rhizophagus irregularis]PKY46696.1 hypothetical protein RhiirA4_402743 [Rhizophagus irregularis]